MKREGCEGKSEWKVGTKCFWVTLCAVPHGTFRATCSACQSSFEKSTGFHFHPSAKISLEEKCTGSAEHFPPWLSLRHGHFMAHYLPSESDDMFLQQLEWFVSNDQLLLLVRSEFSSVMDYSNRN